MSAQTRRFVAGCEEREDAAALAARMAAVLVRAGLTERYGVSVHRIPVTRHDEGWGVYLTDREPNQDPPVVLSFGPVAAPAFGRAA